MEMVCDGFAGFIRKQEHSLGFQDDPLEDNLRSVHPNEFLAVSVEMARGNIEHRAVVLHLMKIPEVFLDQVFIIGNNVVFQGIGFRIIFKIPGDKIIALFEDDQDEVLDNGR